jgi:hypothetical protein
MFIAIKRFKKSQHLTKKYFTLDNVLIVLAATKKGNKSQMFYHLTTSKQIFLNKKVYTVFQIC